MISVLLRILNAGGLVGAISEVTNMAVSFLGGKIPEKVILAAGLLVAVLVGTLGYKYIKLLSTAAFGAVGFVIGYMGFRMAKGHFDWDLPNALNYVAGVAILALLGYLAYKKIAYALFTIAGVTGFLVGYFIYPNYFVGAAAAIIIALVAMHFIRYGFVGLFSVAAGFTVMCIVAKLFPDVSWLSMTEGFVGKLIAVVLSLIFVAIQLNMPGPGSGFGFGANGRRKSGTKRVKIRRVFDTW